MAKTVYLTMRINAGLKAKLQALADEDYRILSDFIETHLHQTASSSKANRKSLEVTAPKATLKSQIARPERTARLTMRIHSQLKEKLQKLARKQYPTLTDFIETELYRIAAAPKEIRKRPLPLRQTRPTYLSLRMNPELKDDLQELADKENRKLVDFVELELRRIVAARKAERRSQ